MKCIAVSRDSSRARPGTAFVLRYGLAVVSVVAAVAPTFVLRHHDTPPRFFSHFILIAIAITFWYAGTGPGLVSLLISCAATAAMLRNHFLYSDFPLTRFLIFYGVFSVLLGWFSALRRGAERLLTESRDTLEIRVAERTDELVRVNQALHNTQNELRRRGEHLAEAQKLSQTGSFGWRVSTGEIFWSDETFRVFEYDRATKPTLKLLLERVHPEDTACIKQAIEGASHGGETFEHECRLIMPDRSGKHVHVVARAMSEKSSDIEVLGVVMDVTFRKGMEETLRSTETRLSQAMQIATVGELSASIAHEINQPLAAVVASGQACVRFLSAQPPNLAKAQEAAESIVRDGKEAGEVVRRIRALFKRAAAVEKVKLNLNDVIHEVLRLLNSEIVKRHVAVEMDLGNDLPLVAGDRVQLQQLVLNLLLNGIEAMDAVRDRPKQLFVRSKQDSPETVLVEVQDCGVGLANLDTVFDPFVTTKQNGMGMGLTICRSIAEAHNGRLWAESGDGPGAKFCFALPVQLTLES